MKLFIPCLLLVITCSISCTPEKPSADDDLTLVESDAKSEFFSKRYEADFVNELYKELAEKDPELKEFEVRLIASEAAKEDSTKNFNLYNQKNHRYFSDAKMHIDQIKDSLLKSKIKLLVSKSLSQYQASISAHEILLDKIDQESVSLNDLHHALKVIRTLPIITAYQHKRKPNLKPLINVSHTLEQTLKIADTLVKK